MDKVKSIGFLRIWHLFYFHLIVFVLNTFNISVYLAQVNRLIITGVYGLVCVWILFIKAKKIDLQNFSILLSLLIIQLLQLFFIHKIPHFNIYFILIYFLFYSFYIPFSTFLKWINFSFLLYAILSIIFFMFPQLPFVNYAYVSYPNRFLPFMDRLYGIEGSPAAIDTFSMVVFLFNLMERRTEKKIGNLIIMILSVLIFLWTGSYTPIAAIFLAYIFAYPLYNYKRSILLVVIFLPLFILIVYLNTNFNVRFLLDILTSKRTIIWNLMIEEFRGQSFIKMLLGMGLQPEIEFGEKVTNNPHNFIINLLILNGYLFIVWIYFFVLNNIKKKRDKYELFLIYYIIISSQTNYYTISIYNPVIIFSLFYVLTNSKIVNSDAKRLSICNHPDL